MSEQYADGVSMSDSYQVEVKGPDPDVWGTDEQRPAPHDLLQPMAIGEIRNEGTPDEVKGPGPEWDTNQ